MSKPAINFLLLVVMLLIISPFGFVNAQGASQTVTLDMIPVGIEGDASGTISLELPVGYQFWGAYPNESNWGTETASWQDYDYHGTRVIQTVTFPDGNSDEQTNNEMDSVGFGGGVVYIRGDVVISAEAEKNQRPYIEGEIISEGTVMVSDYQGYYYLSTRIKEETGEWEWVYGYNNLALRVALSQTEPLYTLWLHLWTWGPVDFTDSQGVRYTFILDGQQVMATHRQYLEMMLSTVTINWTPPSAIPTTPPTTTPSLTTTVETSPPTLPTIAETPPLPTALAEMHTGIDTHFSITMDASVQVADYCSTFWEIWRDGTKEEVLQLAEDHPLMVTLVGQAKDELDSAETIIDEAKGWDIPAWYRDYLSKKEEAAVHLANILQQCEQFLTLAAPMAEIVTDLISTFEEIINLWGEAMPEIESLIGSGEYDQAQQRLTTILDSFNDMEDVLTKAYDQVGVPILQWLRDRVNSLREVYSLMAELIPAIQEGDVGLTQQLQHDIEALSLEEMEIIQSIPWDESNTWFEEHFGSFVDQIRVNLEEAVSLNAEAELSYEAHWTPTAEELEQIYCVVGTDAVDDVKDYFDATLYPERTPVTVGGHPDIDLMRSHIRVQGDNVIFWLETKGDIMDDPWVSYEFSGYTQPDYEGYMSIEYCYGEAEHYISATAEFNSCRYYMSGNALMFIIPEGVFISPNLWDFEVSASDGRLWMEESQGYSDILFLTKPEHEEVTPTPTPTPPSEPATVDEERTFVGSVPLPSQISTDPEVIGTNALLASLLVIAFYIAATLFNNTFRENYEIIQGWFRRLFGWMTVFRRKKGTQQKTKARQLVYLEALFIVVLTALIDCFVDPYFGLNLQGLSLFLGITIAAIVLTYGYEGTQAMISRRRFRIPAVVKVYPLAIPLAIAFVILSRAIDFHPGLVFGFVGAYAILSPSIRPDKRQQSIGILLGVIIVIVVAASAFFLRELVSGLAVEEASLWPSLAETALVGIFVLCLEGVIFGLVPLAFMDGATLMAWKKWVWFIVFAAVSFIFYHIIVNKQGTLTEAVVDMKVITMFGVMGFFILLSGVTWLYFRLRQG